MYTLSDREWAALAVLAQCATEAIPDCEMDGLGSYPRQAVVIAAVSKTIGMLANSQYEFEERDLRQTIEVLYEVAKDFLRDNQCDHETNICYCDLGVAAVTMHHVLWHVTDIEHSHCDRCGMWTREEGGAHHCLNP